MVPAAFWPFRAWKGTPAASCPSGRRKETSHLNTSSKTGHRGSEDSSRGTLNSDDQIHRMLCIYSGQEAPRDCIDITQVNR